MNNVHATINALAALQERAEQEAEREKYAHRLLEHIEDALAAAHEGSLVVARAELVGAITALNHLTRRGSLSA